MPTSVEIFAPEPWGRQSDETDTEFEAFKAFRDAPPLERPTLLPILCRDYGLKDYELKDMSRKHHWLIRVAKYDTWLDASRRQGAIRARFEIGASLVRLSKVIMKKAEDGLEYLERNNQHPSYREAVEMARLGIELQRAGFGLQGVATEKDIKGDVQLSETPEGFIEAAMTISTRIRQKIKDTPITPEDLETIIENVSEKQPDSE